MTRPAGPHAGLVARLRDLSDDAHSAWAGSIEGRDVIQTALSEAATALQRAPEPWTRHEITKRIQAAVKADSALIEFAALRVSDREVIHAEAEWIANALLHPSAEPETR